MSATSAAGPGDAESSVGPKGPSVMPVLGALATFFFFVMVGTIFFVFFPGENKTFGQGVYMSMITLSTVGFGAFTPVTEGGMVFGAFWMIFGVAALGSAVGAFSAWTVALKKEAGREEEEKAAEAVLRNKLTDSSGMVDKLGYLRYTLMKWDLVEKEEIDQILDQFESFRTENDKGLVDVDRILSL